MQELNLQIFKGAIEQYAIEADAARENIEALTTTCDSGAIDGPVLEIVFAGDPSVVALLARFEQNLRRHADAVRDYRRSLIRARERSRRAE